MGRIIEFDFGMTKKKEEVCSFCKKPRSRVDMLIGVEGKPHICSKCVERCNYLLSLYGDKS